MISIHFYKYLGLHRVSLAMEIKRKQKYVKNRGRKYTFEGVQRGVKAPFGHGVEGSLKALLVVVQGAKTLVSMKWRYPIGGRLVSRIEGGFTKGQARPLFVVRRRKACAYPNRIGLVDGVWG